MQLYICIYIYINLVSEAIIRRRVSQRFYLLMFQMEKFHHSMRCSPKDHQILESTYNQCDSVYYISYEFKIDECQTELHCLYH